MKQFAKQIDLYLDEIIKWNKVVRLTGHKNREDIRNLLVAESFLVLSNLQRFSWEVLVDIGSGNGLLAIPAALLFPGKSIVVIEPNLKKSLFISTVGRKLQLSNISFSSSKLQDINYNDYPLDTIWTSRSIEIDLKVFSEIALSRFNSLLLFFSENSKASILVETFKAFYAQSHIFPSINPNRKALLFTNTAKSNTQDFVAATEK